MQAVILAGGLGSRLQPLTRETPKPMVRAGGRPFLEYILRLLRKQGFRRVLVLTGYLGALVEEFFRDGRDWDLDIEYSRESRPLGTGGALRNALPRLDAEFLLLYGDSYLPIEYRVVVDCFRSAGTDGLVVIYDNTRGDTGVLNNIAIDESGHVVRYDKARSGPGLDYVEAGALCLRRKVIQTLPPDTVISLEQKVLPQLIANRQLRCCITRQRFYDIGTPARLGEFEAVIR